MKKRLQKDNVLAQMWGSALMSVVLSLEMPLIANGSVTLNAFCTGFLVSFFASLALKLFTPIIDAGGFLARKLGAKPGKFDIHAMSTAEKHLPLGGNCAMIPKGDAL